MRQREIDILQKQRAQALQDAAESEAAKDQLERAIKQARRIPSPWITSPCIILHRPS